MKKNLILLLILMNTQLNSITTSRVLLPLKRLSKFYPSTARIVSLLRPEYSEEEFNNMVQSIIDGTLQPFLIEKCYYTNNQDLNKLHTAIEIARRENPLELKGRKLTKGKNEITLQIFIISGNNSSLIRAFHRIRPFYDNDQDFLDMLSFLQKNVPLESLWEMYRRTDCNSKIFYKRIMDLQWAHSL